jgi:endonuclease-3 related protein
MVSNPALHKLLMNFYRELLARFGPRHWWPAETPFEVCVGAVLTQNTAWKNVTRAITNLMEADVLDPEKIFALPLNELAELIRPAGYYNVKAQRLRNFVSLLMERHEGNLFSLLSLPRNSLRRELLSVNGIGPETADSIILYAAHKPVFVTDAYTKRILYRHGLVAHTADYASIQNLFESNLTMDVGLFNDFHAQLVAVGHHYCKKKPLCPDCPLQQFPVRKDRQMNTEREP